MVKKEDEYIELGYVTQVHGIKGAFNFRLHNTLESVLKRGLGLKLVPSQPKSALPLEGKDVVVKSVAFGNKILVFLEGIADRTQAESLLPFKVMISRSKLPRLEEDEGFYVQDLLGCTAFLKDENKEFGKIVDFYDTGAQIVFVIDSDGEKIDIPFIDQFFPCVDIENRKVEIILPDFV